MLDQFPNPAESNKSVMNSPLSCGYFIKLNRYTSRSHKVTFWFSRLGIGDWRLILSNNQSLISNLLSKMFGYGRLQYIKANISSVQQANGEKYFITHIKQIIYIYPSSYLHSPIKYGIVLCVDHKAAHQSGCLTTPKNSSHLGLEFILQ